MFQGSFLNGRCFTERGLMTPIDLATAVRLEFGFYQVAARRREWEKHSLGHPESDISTFLACLPGAACMLDAGCGWARYVYVFLDAGIEYVGLDFSSEMLVVATQEYPDCQFVEGSVAEMPFPANSFDGVWSCCVLTSIPKAYIVEVLQEHYRVLKPGGVLYVVMSHCYESKDVAFSDADRTRLTGAIYHTEEFEFCLRRAGFVVEEARERDEHGSHYFIARKPQQVEEKEE